MIKTVGIIQPGRIGDIIIVLPIAAYYHDRGYTVYWPVPARYLPMFDCVDYVIPLRMPDISSAPIPYWMAMYRSWNMGVSTILDVGIGFGHRESWWRESGMRFDEWKYQQAGVPYSERFNLRILRNREREDQLARKVGVYGRKGYVVTHSIGSGFRHDFGIRDAIEVRAIYGHTVWDWIGVIERADHLYAIDSCVANMANQLGLAIGRRTFKSWEDHPSPQAKLAVEW